MLTPKDVRTQYSRSDCLGPRDLPEDLNESLPISIFTEPCRSMLEPSIKVAQKVIPPVTGNGPQSLLLP